MMGAIVMALIGTVWTVVSAKLALISWVGFIGCTSYFASGGGKIGLKKSIIANLTGGLWAISIIALQNYFEIANPSIIITAIFSFIMVFQCKIKSLSFVPGTYCGACAIFGTNGDVRGAFIALIIGGVMGYVSDTLGKYLYSLIKNNKRITPSSIE